MSYRRRLLHGKIDILRAELVARLQKTEGRSVLEPVDVDALTEILTGKARPAVADGARLLPRVRVQQPGVRALLREVRRGARRARGGRADRGVRAPSCATSLDTLDDLGLHGAALVVRSGGGRSGETFALEASPTVIGRSPECGDLPRRRHRLAQARGASRRTATAGGSRTRAASTGRSSTASASTRPSSSDGDELQIGKYRLTYLHALMSTTEATAAPRGSSRSGRSAAGSTTSSRTSRSRRSATSRIRASSTRGARRAATASSRRTTSSGWRRSSACSATSSCRCA